MNTGLFVGSFDPFTIGHDSIVRRALPLFDRLIIGIGVNEGKRRSATAEERKREIELIYTGESRVKVMTYTGLTADLAKAVGAHYIIKGVRSVRDFESEREQADINRRLTGVETLLLFAEPQLGSVSSSVVRELAHFGKDVSDLLPKRGEPEEAVDGDIMTRQQRL